MRAIALLALLVGCAEGEVNDEFVQEGSTHYFAPLSEGNPAIGITFGEDSTVKASFSETDEDGVTPSDICLRGSIGTAFGDMTSGCMEQDLVVMEDGGFSTWVDVPDTELKVLVTGKFLEEDAFLDLTLHAVGSIVLARCLDDSCDELR